MTRTARPAFDPTWLGSAERAGVDPYPRLPPHCGFANAPRAQPVVAAMPGSLALELTSDQPAIDLNPQACIVVILRDGTDGGVYPLFRNGRHREPRGRYCVE